MAKMKIIVGKDKLQDVIQKGLGVKGGQTILQNVLVRFDKKEIIFGELLGISLGVVGRFDKKYFSEYTVKKKTDIVFDLAHLTKLGFLRDSKIELTMADESLLMSGSSGKEDYPVSLTEKIWDEEDLQPEHVHEAVKPITIKIKREKKSLDFVDLEPTYERSLLKPDSEYYDDEEVGYYPIYAYLQLPRTELSGLPSCDSLVFRRTTVVERGKKATPAIELETIVKLEIGKGYKRVLSEIEFLKWQDTSGFEVRVDRAHFDRALSHLGENVNIVISRDYMFLSDVQEHFWLGYLIGLVEEDADADLGEDDEEEDDETVPEIEDAMDDDEEEDDDEEDEEED